MASRVWTRASIISRALFQGARTFGRRRRPEHPLRILIAHHLLLGDTLMLTPLIAKLRALYPHAEIIFLADTAIAPLYEKRPYGVTVWPFDPRDRATLRPMFRSSGFDLAFVAADNRHSWLALALGARWIVAHAGDRPAYKNWPVDKLVAYPREPAAWGDIAAMLVEGPPPAPYDPSVWPAPSCTRFELPSRPYALLHVGASTPLKLWEPKKWRALAADLSKRGLDVVWSGSKSETAIVGEIDPHRRHVSYAGLLDLPQLWRLVQSAALLVVPDTGIAHLGRITDTPTVTLFGPGSALICGAGDFWRNSPYRAVTVEDFHCRDQRVLFKREIHWVRRCERSVKECPAPACMQAIQVEPVQAAIDDLLRAKAKLRP